MSFRGTRPGPSSAAVTITVPIVTFEEFLGEIDRDVPPTVELAPDDKATMFYTSGTTGHPKGAVGSHRNVISNFMNLAFGALPRRATRGDAA